MSHSAPLEHLSFFVAPGGAQIVIQAPSPMPGDDNTASVAPTDSLRLAPGDLRHNIHPDEPGDGEHLNLPSPVGPYCGPEGPPLYPDSIAQGYKSFDGVDQLVPGPGPREIRLEVSCPGWMVVGECEGYGHSWAKAVICNREWCWSCGGNNGQAHQRRKAGWLPRATQMSEMGYFVIPIPPELREKFRDTQVVRDFGKSIKRVMKYHGFDRGLRRWHWFGEDHPGEGMQGDGLPPYHPHLNLLVEAGWLPAAKLLAIRRSVGKVLGVELARVVVNYSYTKTVARMLHMVKYVLRPTFRDCEWDREMAFKLVGFRNSLSWGTWKDEPVWEVTADDAKDLAVGSLERGFCPIDGTRIVWGKVMSAKLLEGPWWVDVGGGYWSWTGLVRDGPGP